MAKTRILIVHPDSVIRRTIAKGLESLPRVSVASSSIDSDMLGYLITQYKPHFILRDTQPIHYLEKKILLAHLKVTILSLIPFPFTTAPTPLELKKLISAVFKEIEKFEKKSAQDTELSGLPLIKKKNRNSLINKLKVPLSTSKNVDEPTFSKRPFDKIIFCGASTGGTDALKVFLSELPPDCPPVFIAQHMPEGFTHSFAERLNKTCPIWISEAEDRIPIHSGCAYIAPGHSHLFIEQIGPTFYTRLSQSATVNRHRPSVEVLFLSAAEVVGQKAIGIMFTGMGKDGALAMLKMRQAGAYNIAQDETSSIVYGMPREAAALGAVHEILPLDQIAKRVLQLSHIKPDAI